MVDFERLRTFLDRDGEDPVAYGVQFRDAKPHTTLSFLREGGGGVHMYVYVDRGHLPIAMAMVHPPTPRATHGGIMGADRPRYEELVLDLYAALREMTSLARARQSFSRQGRQTRALERATDAARTLEAVELAKTA